MTRVNPWVIGGIAAMVVLVCLTGALIVFSMPSPSVPDTSPNPVAQVGPPQPSASARAAYLAELDAIDPEIVHGKPDQAVNRGRDQCTSITQWPSDQARLVELVQRRFTSPTHPQGFGQEKSARILETIRRHLCPSVGV